MVSIFARPPAFAPYCAFARCLGGFCIYRWRRSKAGCESLGAAGEAPVVGRFNVSTTLFRNGWRPFLSMNIITLLNQIESGEIVLPAIQRDFVWDERKIQMLMDSITRGYPVGIVLMWETFEDIQYRHFVRGYIEDNRPSFHENSQRKKLKVVLDGQQRLQSLYLALFGTYEGKYLHFDILSGREADSFREEKYHFYFESSDNAERRNLATVDYLETPEDKRNNGAELEYLVKVNDLFAMSASDRIKLRKEIARRLRLNEDDELRLETNLTRLDEVLVKDENILKTSTIDENRPSNSPERKSESDVLEIFVRVNRQGTPLSRSDLIFSMLKLNWKDSASTLPEFVESINEGNSFELDVDFVIRCLFAVSDLGTKFDIELLRKKENMEKIRGNFLQCCEAIGSTVDIVQRDCWCSSSKALGSYNTLVPFVYYLFHTPNHQVPNSEVSKFRKALYLFGFTTPFSRYADSRLAKFIREELKPRLGTKDYSFPFDKAVKWVSYWERVKGYSLEMLQRNPRLALYLVQHYSGAEAHFKANAPDIDHIFPRSELRKRGFEETDINHVANFWVLGKGKNQNKSAKHPKKYFEGVDDAEMKRAFIDPRMLDYKSYRRFLQQRGQKILAYVKEKVDFSDSDFRLGNGI
jgi:hypothetical protein